MKKIIALRLFAAVMGLAVLTGTGCVSSECCAKACAQQDRMLLPKDLYAVPGIECNVYFRNIFLAINHSNYVFDVTCKFGRNDLKRWRFTPKAEDGGKTFPITISVYDRAGKLAAESTATVHVAPADAGKGRPVTILMVGDSLTNATVYPARLHELCQGDNNPKLTMLGTHRGSARKPVPGGVAHEGYGGWRWDSFLTRWKDFSKKEKPTPLKIFYARSKFLMLKDGKPVFSLANYLKENNFKMPDVITFQLGVNDVFGATDANRAEKIQEILKNADKLIAAFRKEAPDALIGVGFVTPGSNQDGFGKSYACRQTAWGYYCNQFRLNQAMAKHFAGQKNLVLVPVNVNLDTENNFPTKKEVVNAENPTEIFRQSNGVHPAPAGYKQIGDVYYAWLKNMLTEKQEKTAK